MTSPPRKNTVDRAFLRQLVLWPVLFASGALVVTQLTSACLDDLPALVDAASFEDAATNCGDGLVATNQNGTDAGESCDPADAAATTTYPGCVDCQLACPDGVLDDVGHHCFFSAGTAASFSAAANACAIRKGHIVTIASAREADLAEGSGAVDLGVGYWLGISNNGAAGGYAPPEATEPGYPDTTTGACPGCFAFGALDGGDFPLLDPSTASLTNLCLVARNVTGTRKWFRVPCSTTTQFSVLCEREPPGRRITDCTGYKCTTIFNTEGRKRYLISIAEQVTADEVRSRCAQFLPDGKPVIFKTREEREDLMRELFKLQLTDTTLWIGLAVDEAGAWHWDDGTPESPGYPIIWGSGQPNGTGAGRAYVRLGTQFDTQLAYSTSSDFAEGGVPIRGYICERTP